MLMTMVDADDNVCRLMVGQAGDALEAAEMYTNSS